MPSRITHTDNSYPFFITFTCYQWIPLIKISNGYNLVYDWFEVLIEKGVKIYGFVIMPNHVHCIIELPENNYSLNALVSNGKRFIAYGIIKQLQKLGQNDILKRLRNGVSPSEQKSGKLHKVFKTSFDAQLCSSQNDLETFLHYIHVNPVSGKWRLAEEYTQYKHSSVRFYEFQEKFTARFKLTHYLDS